MTVGLGRPFVSSSDSWSSFLPVDGAIAGGLSEARPVADEAALLKALDDLRSPGRVIVDELQERALVEIDALPSAFKMPIVLGGLVFRKRAIQFPRDLNGNLTRESGRFRLEFPEIGLVVRGSSVSSLIEQLALNMEQTLSSLGRTSESELRPHDLQLKHVLIELTGG